MTILPACPYVCVLKKLIRVYDTSHSLPLPIPRRTDRRRVEVLARALVRGKSRSVGFSYEDTACHTWYVRHVHRVSHRGSHSIMHGGLISCMPTLKLKVVPKFHAILGTSHDRHHLISFRVQTLCLTRVQFTQSYLISSDFTFPFVLD